MPRGAPGYANNPQGTGISPQAETPYGIHVNAGWRVPLTGMLASQFGGRVVSWFGLFDIPVLLAPDKAFAGQLMGLHKDLLWPLLLVLLAGHVGAALWHHVITRDRTLRRMLPFLD